MGALAFNLRDMALLSSSSDETVTIWNGEQRCLLKALGAIEDLKELQ